MVPGGHVQHQSITGSSHLGLGATLVVNLPGRPGPAVGSVLAYIGLRKGER